MGEILLNWAQFVTGRRSCAICLKIPSNPFSDYDRLSFLKRCKTRASGGWWSRLLRFLLWRKRFLERWLRVGADCFWVAFLTFFPLSQSHSHGLPVINAQSLLLLLGDCQASGLGLSSSRMGAKCLIAILGRRLVFNWQTQLARARHCYVARQFNLYSTKPHCHSCCGCFSPTTTTRWAWEVDNDGMSWLAKLEIRPFDTSRWWESLGQLWLRVK